MFGFLIKGPFLFLILLALQDPTLSRSDVRVSLCPFGFYGRRVVFSSSSSRCLSLIFRFSLPFSFSGAGGAQTPACVVSCFVLVFVLGGTQEPLLFGGAPLLVAPEALARTFVSPGLLVLFWFFFCFFSLSLSVSLRLLAKTLAHADALREHPGTTGTYG